MDPPAPARVLIVEDDSAFSVALQYLIESDPGFKVVGHASNGDQALTLAIALRPDIVTMDIEMPVRDGVEATRLISHLVPTVKVVIVSGSPRRHRDALATGAVGYVAKGDAAVLLLDVLRTVAARD